MRLFIYFISLLTHTICMSQTPTVGVRYFDPSVSDGYTLFTPEKNESVLLINNCGEKINEWTFNDRPGLTCYILENGNLLRAGKDVIEIRDWDNTIVWSFNLDTFGLNQHHDIEPLPNGNILCIIGDNYPESQMVALGKMPATFSEEFKLDKIIELEPVGLNDANIVWEWKFIDHLIQDYDHTKPNFGSVEDHPELLDLNYIDDEEQNSNYTHINGIDYNADLDQIVISARNLNEIYIIDHSTTTLEAAGHTGGNSNAGGDFLWRWGNPRVYGRGTVADKKLVLQHDPKWVTPGYLDEGKISVFNNGGDGTGTFSSVHLIQPEIVNGSYVLENDRFQPSDFDWSWNGSIEGEIVLEQRKSGTHSLPNGNFIVTETSKGQVSEISKLGEQLWTYKNPIGLNGNIFDQYETIDASENVLFRAEKYPSDYVGFASVDLTPQAIIENQNTLAVTCSNALSVDQQNFQTLKITNPVKHNTIEFNQVVRFESISLIDINGKTHFTQNNFNGHTLKVNLEPSIYFLALENAKTTVYRKLIIE